MVFLYDIWSNGTIVHPGKAFYDNQCSECHGNNGEGIKSLVPPLNKADFAAHNIDSIPCWLKFGLNHPIVVNDTAYDQPMYPSKMDEVQIANVINFMNQEFFHVDKEVNPAWVRERWKGCK
jgi:mono/diheme cytochrome c family protein